jgi:serine/threonine protein kinase
MEYASPEQWTGKIVVTSDLYALGGTLFFMLTGRHAFKKEKRDPIAFMNAHLREEVPDILAFNQSVPPELNQLFHQMMEKDPNKRGTATELLEAFRQLRPREASSGYAPSPVSGSFNPSRAKSTTVDPTHPTEVVHNKRPIVPKDKTKVQNPLVRASEGLLSLLERVFIPGHLRASPATELGLLERSIALLRRPLMLVILVVILFILIIFS